MHLSTASLLCSTVPVVLRIYADESGQVCHRFNLCNWLSVMSLQPYMKQDMLLQCAEIAEHLAGDMAREDLKGKTLTLKLKTTAFEVRTRAHSLPQHISTAAEIEAVALRLLKAELPIEIRLMGMRMSHFLEVRKEVGQKSIDVFVKQGSHCPGGEGMLASWLSRAELLCGNVCLPNDASGLCR